MVLGEPDPDQMLSNMPARVWSGWKMYSEIEPWGTLENDNQMTSLRVVVARSMGLKSVGGRQIPWDELSVEQLRRKRFGFLRKKVAKTQDQIMNILKHFFGVGKKKKRK